MKQRKLTVLASAGLLLLASCGDPATTESGDSTPALQQPPPPPSPEVLAALKEQAFGSKLLGRTKYLVGEGDVAADLPKAPRYYLLNFSASW